MSIGLSIMRLQPLHNGHKKIIDKMIKENEKSILFIGSMDVSNKDNPFSFDERKQMVKEIYQQEINQNKLIILGIKDIHNPPKWVKYVKSLCPIKCDCYYCGTNQDGYLFEKEGFKTSITNREELNISGTLIREKFKTGDNSWKNLIPEKIHHLILKKGITK